MQYQYRERNRQRRVMDADLLADRACFPLVQPQDARHAIAQSQTEHVEGDDGSSIDANEAFNILHFLALAISASAASTICFAKHARPQPY